jgi:2-keto-4-pentenoate hydratase/2-oxohepta-3-ene-1,7-dioic acid hydratase in catechol pathway
MKMIYSPSENLESFDVLPDSAMGRNKQPWFIPDFGANWRGSLALAARIGRLGKNISPKFATRYVDGVTLVWRPVADDVPAQVMQAMDSAVVVGEWLPVDQQLVVGDASDISPLLQKVLALIVQASKYMTFKTGDIVAVGLTKLDTLTLQQQHIEHRLNASAVLSFNVK